MSSDIQGTKKTAIVLGLIAAGLLALGVHQNNRWIIGGSIGYSKDVDMEDGAILLFSLFLKIEVLNLKF